MVVSGTKLVRHHLVGIELDGYKVKPRLCQAVHADLIKAYSQELVIYAYTQITVVVVLVFFQKQIHLLNDRITLKIFHARTRVGLNRRISLATLYDGIYVVPAISAHNERHVVLVATEFDDSRVALIVVGMGGEESMRIDANLIADCVDFPEHIGTGTMRASLASASWWRRIAERRMMNRNQHRTLIPLILYCVQLCFKIRQLEIRHSSPFFLLTGLTRDHTGVFKGVGEKPNDPHKRRIKSEVHPWLRHRSPVKGTRLGRNSEAGGTE